MGKRIVGNISFIVEVIRLYVDNQSAIHLSKNFIYHDKIKHFDIKFHFVIGLIEKGMVSLVKNFNLIQSF